MAIKMRGVLAVPGEYHYGDRVEKKTAEELKDAAERYPIVPLTFGHTMDGLPPAKAQQIGTVSQKWSEIEQKVLGEFWFHEEKIPESLRKKIDNGESIPISAGLLVDSVDAEGVQHGISYTHIAVLEGEDPRCPLKTCGAFVRLESKDERHEIRLEQVAELAPVPKNAEKQKEPEAAPTPKPDEVKVPEQPKPEAPAVQKPEVKDVAAPAKEEVRLVPETIIPAELGTVRKEFDVIDGKYVFVPSIFKQQEKKK